MEFFDCNECGGRYCSRVAAHLAHLSRSGILDDRLLRRSVGYGQPTIDTGSPEAEQVWHATPRPWTASSDGKRSVIRPLVRSANCENTRGGLVAWHPLLRIHEAPALPGARHAGPCRVL